MLSKIKHILEFAIVKLLYCFFKVLPINTASSIGGFIGKNLGKLLKVNKVARRNLKNAFPEYTDKEIEETILKMWDNLGRVAGEFPHMTSYKGDDFAKIVEVEGAEHIKKAGESGKTAMFFSGHFANWEIVPKTIFEKGCPSINLVYRKSNNPYLDKLILDVRNNYQAGCMPKGTKGARMIIKAIKQGQHIGMLVDQKQNDGIPVPFFGRDAMTAPAIANLALKYDCELIPLQVRRTGGAKFKVKVYEPFKFDNTGDEQKDILIAMTRVNSILESWARQEPSQWFWVHNRWPKE
jgi:KDO2-lipid IV(A) lauroyltransferase